MKAFHQQLLDKADNIWKAMLGHRFLKMTASGTIPDETFKIWMRQDYIFVRDSIPFIAVIIAKSPLELRAGLAPIISAFTTELELFRKNAEAHGVNLENLQPAPTCHAYLQFLMATAYGKSFAEAFTVLYAAEKAYYDSWMEVKKNLKKASPWQSFIDNWTSDAFKQYVDWLAAELDKLAAGKPERELGKMLEIFMMTGRYEYLFWEMAATSEDWPV
jgi:thiaminase/transcriptional activator TenA